MSCVGVKVPKWFFIHRVAPPIKSCPLLFAILMRMSIVPLEMSAVQFVEAPPGIVTLTAPPNEPLRLLTTAGVLVVSVRLK